MYKSKAENPEENSNHEFWRKTILFSCDHIYFPKSVTESKQVPRNEKMSPRGFKFVSNQLSIKLDWLVISVNIVFGFNILLYFCLCVILVTGLAVSENDQLHEVLG